MRKRFVSSRTRYAAAAFIALTASVVGHNSQVQAQERVEAVLRQRVVGLVSPEGVEHALAIGPRWHFGEPGNLLTENAYLEGGAVNYTSPIYSMTGAYIEFSPLAILILRAELLALHMWTIGMVGAGYFPVADYRSELNDSSLHPSQGREATGWNFNLSAVLQFAVDIGPLRGLLWSETAVQYFSTGEAPFYYSPRFDVVLAQSDWIVANHTMLLLEAPLADDLHLRFGGYDASTVVIDSGNVINQAGGVVALALDEADPAVPEIMPLLRMGLYTHHARRSGDFTVLVGAFVRYSL